VIDLAGQAPVDGYEVPAATREALYLRNPACISPWGTNLSRKKDADHTTPYLPKARGGPPGQTTMGNLGLLSRFAHRVKTHGRWSLRQPSPGVFLWRSPHGYWFRVDHTGTHRLGKNPETDHRQHDQRVEPAPVGAEETVVHEVWPSALELHFANLIVHGS
jgi:hypothetical protein